MDAELEEGEMEKIDKEPEGNVEIPGMDMEGKEPPPQVIEINDTDIPQYPSLIDLEVPGDTDGTTQVSTLEIDGLHRSTRVRS